MNNIILGIFIILFGSCTLTKQEVRETRYLAVSEKQKEESSSKIVTNNINLLQKLSLPHRIVRLHVDNTDYKVLLLNPDGEKKWYFVTREKYESLKVHQILKLDNTFYTQDFNNIKVKLN